jgi:hypothetical protein
MSCANRSRGRSLDLQTHNAVEHSLKVISVLLMTGHDTECAANSGHPSISAESPGDKERPARHNLCGGHGAFGVHAGGDLKREEIPGFVPIRAGTIARMMPDITE